jgi:hypothetical protein
MRRNVQVSVAIPLGFHVRQALTTAGVSCTK